MQISGKEQARQWERPVQRPQGRSMTGMGKRPMCLEQSEGECLGDEVKEAMGSDHMGTCRLS
jgi:hypothetical protein